MTPGECEFYNIQLKNSKSEIIRLFFDSHALLQSISEIFKFRVTCWVFLVGITGYMEVIAWIGILSVNFVQLLVAVSLFNATHKKVRPKAGTLNLQIT